MPSCFVCLIGWFVFFCLGLVWVLFVSFGVFCVCVAVFFGFQYVFVVVVWLFVCFNYYYFGGCLGFGFNIFLAQIDFQATLMLFILPVCLGKPPLYWWTKFILSYWERLAFLYLIVLWKKNRYLKHCLRTMDFFTGFFMISAKSPVCLTFWIITVVLHSMSNLMLLFWCWCTQNITYYRQEVDL